MKKTEKTILIQNLSEELKSAKSTILVDYSGLSVGNQQELKKRLKEVDAKMIVVKNTLFKLAGKGVKLPEEVVAGPVLSGQTALILAKDDPVSPLKVLADFAKEFEVIKMKVGIVEGAFQDQEELASLSKLSGKDALQLQVLGGLAAPVYGMVGVLNANINKLILILKEAGKKGGDN